MIPIRISPKAMLLKFSNPMTVNHLSDTARIKLPITGISPTFFNREYCRYVMNKAPTIDPKLDPRPPTTIITKKIMDRKMLKVKGSTCSITNANSPPAIPA
jgi:hypothetical protein